nr:hypothetical protein [uncultured Niameybacter sp.]
MNNRDIKKGLLILAFIMLTVNCLNSYNIRKDLKNLRSDYSNLETYLDMRIGNIQNTINREYENIETLLKQEQSMFSQASVKLKLKGDKIEVTMKAIPKEIENREKLIARIVANDKVYEQEVDGNNQAFILVDIVESIEPILIIQSDTGVRQEVLEKVYTDDIFTGRVFGEWDREEGKSFKTLNAWITVDEEALPFTENDIEKAEFIIVGNESTMGEKRVNQGQRTDYKATKEVRVREEVVEDRYTPNTFEGDRVIGTKKSGEGKFLVGYSMDFSEYMQRQDNIRYEIYFVLTTKDGVEYITPYNPIATFSSSARSSSSGSGDEILKPVFK